MRFLLATLFLITSAHAFINVESLRKNSQEGFNKSATVRFNQQSGNTDKILAGVSTLNSYLSKKNEYIFSGNYRYGESFDRRDTEDGSVHLRYKRNLYRRHHLESYIQYQFNKFKALDFREVYGLGYRHQDKYFNTGIGAFYEQEEIKSRQNEDAIRANLYLSGARELESGFGFSAIIYLQPSLKQSDDLRVIINSGVSQRITDFLNINIEYEYVYDQQPPTDIKKYDSAIMFGFSLI